MNSTHDLATALLGWFDANRRDLPWRRTRDTYAIWISEAMLQQTRVETVIPYWERFLERFPTVDDLARAPEDAVLAAWSGLGYYRRARSLQSAARVVADELGGAFPETREGWLALPGVGPYTAGALLSIAMGRREPVVDGNVLRVFARLFGLESPLGSGALQRETWRLAEELVPPDRPGDWNQALMELGATVCSAREPECGACPLAADCRARLDGRTAELPVPGKKPKPIDVELEVFWLEREGCLAAQLRPDGGRMAGLWELPTREVPAASGLSGLFPRRPAPFDDGSRLRAGRVLGEVRHSITRHRIRAVVRAASSISGSARSASEAETLSWVPREELTSRPHTGMTAKILASCFVPGRAPAQSIRYPSSAR